MLPGPVFHAELLTTARRRRYYAARAAYALALLAILWQGYRALNDYRRVDPEHPLSIGQIAEFARRMSGAILMAQLGLVLLLTPALVAGTIVDERQRRTLDDLLASPLSGAEVVLGKVAARLLHLIVLLGVGLPVFGLLALLGGVEPMVVVGTFAVTATTAFFLAGLGVLVSTRAGQVRDAVLVAYLLTASWLIGPSLVHFVVGMVLPSFAVWGAPATNWIRMTDPISLGLDVDAAARNGPAAVAARVGLTVGLQLALGAAFLALAARGLRRGDPAESRRMARRAARVRRHPPLRSRPMLWKELHVGRPGRLLRRIAWAVVVLGGAFFLLALRFYALPALGEAWGYSRAGDPSHWYRDRFSFFLRASGGLLFAFWALAVALGAAVGLTSEREGDTWTSLITTDLRGAEIVEAKLLGALWRPRFVALLAAASWAVGVLAGAVHPAGFVLALVEVLVFGGFYAALGTLVSLRARTSSRALGLTAALTLFLGGGYLFCCVPLQMNDGVTFAAGFTPLLVAMTLATPDEVRELVGSESWHPHVRTLFACLLGLIAHAVAALVLYATAIAAFDRIVDRPRRPPGLGEDLELRARSLPDADET